MLTIQVECLAIFHLADATSKRRTSHISAYDYVAGENPQYKLQVDVTDGKNAVVWILLSRHILDRVSVKLGYFKLICLYMSTYEVLYMLFLC